jgi:hypothetical protein
LYAQDAEDFDLEGYIAVNAPVLRGFTRLFRQIVADEVDGEPGVIGGDGVIVEKNAIFSPRLGEFGLKFLVRNAAFVGTAATVSKSGHALSTGEVSWKSEVFPKLKISPKTYSMNVSSVAVMVRIAKMVGSIVRNDQGGLTRDMGMERSSDFLVLI